MRKLILSSAGLAARILPTNIKKSLYRSKLVAYIVRAGLNLAVPEGLTEVTVASGELKGMLLALDLKTEKDYWLGTYETDIHKAIMDLAKPGFIAYDVGANIGYVSLLLARAVGENGRVFSFEAFPKNQYRLHKNIALNRWRERVVVVRAAVVESCRPVRFLVGPSGGTGKAEGSAGREELTYSQPIVVTGVSLDAFVYEAGRPAPQIVKMDIEGGEVLALPGMQRLLQEARPVMLLELHGQKAAQVAWEYLTKAGYRLYGMKPGYPPIPNIEALDWKAYLVGLPLGRSDGWQRDR